MPRKRKPHLKEDGSVKAEWQAPHKWEKFDYSTGGNKRTLWRCKTCGYEAGVYTRGEKPEKRWTPDCREYLVKSVLDS